MYSHNKNIGNNLKIVGNFLGSQWNFTKFGNPHNFSNIHMGNIIAAEGGIILVGRHEVKKLVLRIYYHVPEKTRGG